MGFVVNYPPATNVTVNEDGTQVVVAAAGPRGPQGDPGVVAATAPVTYDSGTQTVGIDQSGLTVAQSQVTGLESDLAAKVPSAWATKSAAYTAAAGDHVIDVTGTTTITLPAAASSAGKVFVIRNTGGAAVTIDGNGAELVGGAATQAFTGYGYMRIVCNGTAWLVLDGQYWSETVGRREFVWDTINSRWQMVYGDTGWRNISGSLANGWAVAANGGIVMRRVNNTVHVHANFITGAAKTSDIFYLVPTGFKMTGLTNIYIVFASNSTVRYDVGNLSASHNLQSTATGVFSSAPSWSTTEGWPSSLPGTASGSIPQ